MILDLYIYPHPVLLQVAEPVETFDDDLKKLVDDMADTMYEGNGVGLAAPQIGLGKRLFVVEAQDVEGNWFREEAKELRAVALLHEYAHLDGSVFIDRLSPLKLRLVRKSWGKRIRREAEKTYSESNLHCVFATDAKTDTPT